MYRKELFAKEECPYQNFVVAQDYDLWYRLLRRGAKISNVAEALIKYRTHPRQLTNRQTTLMKAETYDIFCRQNPQRVLTFDEYQVLTLNSIRMGVFKRFQLLKKWKPHLNFSIWFLFVDQGKYLFLRFLRNLGLLWLSPWAHVSGSLDIKPS